MSRRLTTVELKKYPESARRRPEPEPTSEGYCAVGGRRNRPCKLYYKLYGTGPVHIVWISGHGAGIEDFYPSVNHFGIVHPDRYTSLLFENRGVGKSESSWSFPSMKELAQDVLELLSCLNWTGERSVNVVGHSMGGMIAQEMSILDPSRISTLTLISTSSYWLNDLKYSASKATLSALIPKGVDARLADAAQMLFGIAWLDAPDEVTPGVFPTNYDAWAAGTIDKPQHVKGAIMQARACIGHFVKAEDLLRLGQLIGGSRIIVVHGRADNLAPVSAAERTYASLGGSTAGVELHLFDLVGHMVHVERTRDVVSLIERKIELSEQSSRA